MHDTIKTNEFFIGNCIVYNWLCGGYIDFSHLNNFCVHEKWHICVFTKVKKNINYSYNLSSRTGKNVYFLESRWPNFSQFVYKKLQFRFVKIWNAIAICRKVLYREGGSTQVYWCTYAWTKKGVFCSRTHNAGNMFRGLKCHFMGKRRLFCQNVLIFFRQTYLGRYCAPGGGS